MGWQGETEVFGEKPNPLSIFPLQISHILISSRTRSWCRTPIW